MTLNKQKISVVMAKGIGSLVDDKLITDGSLIDLINMNFKKQGQVSKRYGSDKLGKRDSSGNIITNNKMITNYGNSLVQIANNTL